MEKARQEGIDVTCDRYPYIASNTGLQAILPNWASEGNRETRIDRLRNDNLREKIRCDIFKKHPEEGYWDTIVISTLTSEKNRSYEGRSIAEGAGMTGKTPFDFAMDLLIEEEANVSAIYFTMSEDNLLDIYKKPYTMIGSDAACRADYGQLSEGKPHPRAFGTFPRVLGKYSRDQSAIKLATAVKKMTSDPCRKMGISKRGELREGFFADLVVFDPDTIMDKATFSDPVQYPEGIEYVIVNGNIVVEKGCHTGCRGGRVLKKNG